MDFSNINLEELEKLIDQASLARKLYKMNEDRQNSPANDEVLIDESERRNVISITTKKPA